MSDFENYIQALEAQLEVVSAEAKSIEAELLKARDLSYKLKVFKNEGRLDISVIHEGLRNKFERLSIRNCLKIIAKENNNVLAIEDARKILRQAGRNVTNLAADLVRTPEFIRIGHGVYQFKESESQ